MVISRKGTTSSAGVVKYSPPLALPAVASKFHDAVEIAQKCIADFTAEEHRSAKSS
jgi:hypothetical protein